MKKAFLALAMLASTSAFAQTAPKPVAKAAPRADHCTGAAAAKCDKDMASAKADMASMPACCRAKMAAAKAAEAKTASAEVKTTTTSL